MAGSDYENVWDAFDVALERTEAALEQSRENYETIRRLDEPLADVYGAALASIADELESFDSIYDVTESELNRVKSVEGRTRYLAAVTTAYREYHEAVIDRRVAIFAEWFEILDGAVDDTVDDMAADWTTLARRVMGLEKLTDAGKYAQLRDSDRIELDDIEKRVREFDDALQSSLSTSSYVDCGLELEKTFHNRFTNDLSTLIEAGVDRGAISVAECIQDVPNTDPIREKAAEGATTSEHVESLSSTVESYADLALLTGKRRAKYELGAALLDAIDENPVEDDELADGLRPKLSVLDLEPIEGRASAIVNDGASIAQEERLLRLLAEHDGSVRRTTNAVERSTEEVFDDLYHLFEGEEIRDLEVQFE